MSVILSVWAMHPPLTCELSCPVIRLGPCIFVKGVYGSIFIVTNEIEMCISVSAEAFCSTHLTRIGSANLPLDTSGAIIPAWTTEPASYIMERQAAFHEGTVPSLKLPSLS